MDFRNVILLAGGQALMVSAMSVVIITSAEVGKILAPNQLLITLPVAALFVAITFTSIPASLFMEKYGRKTGFVWASLFGVAGAGLATWAIISKSFWLFVCGTTLMGIFNGFGNFFRFTAADIVSKKFKSNAIAYVLAGGILAAFLGASLASNFKEAIPGATYAGGYASLIAGYCIIFILMSFLKLPANKIAITDSSIIAKDTEVSNHLQAKPARSLKTIIRQPKYSVAVICGMFGYGVMSFIMTATPPAMGHTSQAVRTTIPFVIQWHMLAMFVPSFFTGTLINRFGVYKIMFIGGLLGLCCVVVNQFGESVWHYWSALVLLGLSWNFTFTGATSLLTQTYRPSERGKAQAFNDFIVFATVSIASLSAGALQHLYGWQTVNVGVIPLLIIILACVIWISFWDPDRDQDQKRDLRHNQQKIKAV
ncbi:Uncharacterized MFS-type transporter [hydrothermal vent metagenome]|uniref:Uncharacterized MFS-type transporter n=1 Tax=hydrothermal vent metagenome TaxID=652676 RepID=A0A3B0Y5K9_9ZZZZ